MARWEPDAWQRLERAALDLFLERGYDNTTVTDIAERAGLTKSTFFRHFPDKREVLFSGEDRLLKLFNEAIAAAPASATPLQAIAAALAAADAVFIPERHPLAAQRREVVGKNSELLERQALKRERSAEAMANALRDRGIPDPDATVAAQLGVLAFRHAFARWADPANWLSYAEHAKQCLDELHAASASLT
jgi:AcrR family transcriptional regulator